jgi:serine/threonine protein kinase/Tol biopolymer transport system component
MQDSVTGRVFAHCKIEEKLGQGGMGAVYRAWDANLHRWVAIKLVETGSGERTEKHERFLLEARAASALNHPNIVTIHEIGQHDEFAYIVMEYVPGKTLHKLIHEARGLSVSDVLKYGVQIADAVAGAHAAGITHRDLKPANILITDRGRVKVVDFGLAKRFEADESGATQTLAAETKEGTVVGTLHYMSPEQVQGKKVDGRSDIFAIGAILYEMLTRSRAFEGDSMAAVIVSIMTKDPPPVSSTRPVPEALDRLIARCLRKDIEKRMQHADDLKIALEELRSECEGSAIYTTNAWTAASTSGVPVSSRALAPYSTGPSSFSSPATAVHRSRARWASAAVLMLAALLAGGWFYIKHRPAEPVATPTLRRMTSDVGLTGWPALSQDGKFLVYASDRGEQTNLHIWLQQVGGGSPIRLTSGDADDMEPSFSPDGTRVAFHSARDGGGVYVVSTLGGEPRLLAKYGKRPQFSPDGSKIVYWVGGDFGKVFIMDANGGPAHPIQAGFANARFPVWSPDGKSILFEGYMRPDYDPETDKDWWLAPLDDGAATRTGLLPHFKSQRITADSGPAAWLPNNEILFAGRLDDVASAWTAKVSAGTAKIVDTPKRLTFGTNIDRHPAAGVDSSGEVRIVFSSMSRKIDLWAVALDGNTGKLTGELQRITHGDGSSADQLSMSLDGRRIAYSSDRDGKQRPWVRDMKTGKEVAVNASGLLWTPSINLDGSLLAWNVYVNGRATRTFKAAIAADGQLGSPELLCDKCGSIISWAADGRRVVYAKMGRPGGAAFLDLTTGETYDLLKDGQTDIWGGRFSPDGRWLLFNVTPSPVESRVYIAPFDPSRRGPVPVSEWVPVTDGSSWDDKPRWSPDGHSVIFVSHRDGYRCIWRQALDPQTRRPLEAPSAVLHLHRARLSMSNVNIGPLSIQVAHDKLVFSLGELTGNVWMLTSETP